MTQPTPAPAAPKPIVVKSRKGAKQYDPMTGKKVPCG